MTIELKGSVKKHAAPVNPRTAWDDLKLKFQSAASVPRCLDSTHTATRQVVQVGKAQISMMICECGKKK